MKIRNTITLPHLQSIVVGSHLGLPAARFMVGSVVKAMHIGPGAEKRAWRSYHRFEEAIPVYELGSAVEPDMHIPDEILEKA